MRLRRDAGVSELLTLPSTSVERLRHLNSLIIFLVPLLVLPTACWFKHLEIHQLRRRSKLLALHLQSLGTGKKEKC